MPPLLGRCFPSRQQAHRTREENTTNTTETQTTAGQIVELGRYNTPSGERKLLGRRIDGQVRVYDTPADGEGRRYFVDAGFESKAELAVLVADYKRQANKLGRCPMEAGAAQAALGL